MKPLEVAIRDAFLTSAEGKLRVENATMTQETKGRRLFFTGFHRDKTPFAVETQPFTGSPIERAALLAQDILTTHTGVPMAAPQPIKGLAAVLRDQLKAATDRANSIADKAKGSVSNLNTVLDGAEGVVKEVDAAAADIQSALGISTNGGPRLDG